MKRTLALVVCSLGILLSTTSFASCGDEWGCGNSSDQGVFSCGGPGPGTSCSCADPACREDNPCLSACKCCEAFGNIAGIDGFPND